MFENAGTLPSNLETQPSRTKRVPPPKLSREVMFQRLAAERPMTSLIDKEIIAEGSCFESSRDDWVPLYYDTGNKVTSDDMTMVTYRAIAERGELMWLVFHKRRKHAYHASQTCPFDAFDEAACVYAERSRVKSDWQRVQVLAQKLRSRKINLTVTRQDAEECALCYLGTQYFLRRFGKEHITTISGFWPAWLMPLEPQIGFILYKAAERAKIAF